MAAAAVGVLALVISIGWLVLGWLREGSAVAASWAGESTMVRICLARTVLARWGVVGSVVLGGACVVGADCVREGGTGAGGLVVSISGAVVVGCACLTLFRVLVLLSRWFEFLGLFVRWVSFPRGNSWGCTARFGSACAEAAEYANG